MTDDNAFVISAGYITLRRGVVTVILHNVWVWNWPVAITILGWSTLINGISKVGWPEQIHTQAPRFKTCQWVSSAFIILLGAGLLWLSLM